MNESRFSSRQRTVSAVLVVFFALVTIVSTVLSLGSYCLTTDGGNTRDLAETLRLIEP